MLTPITAELLASGRIANPVFRREAQLYLDIEADFRAQVEDFGLPFADPVVGPVASPAAKPAAAPAASAAAATTTADPPAPAHIMEPADPWVTSLASRGLTIANDRRSLHTGWISPSCVSCRTGTGTATYLISTQCPRECFFCFNPNQANYERLRQELDDPAARLTELHGKGVPFHDLALTGGEPLLHKAQTEAFFRTAQRLYPDAYTRLYTSGAFFDADCARTLASAGLREIRFSIKTDDTPGALATTFERMSLAREHLPHVVVEMPVMPDEQARMEELLCALDELGIDGINLLELCFPYHNAAEFARRGYALKPRLFRVFYNYSYAGGLPVAGSEDVCLRLLGFALDRGLRLGVHYCSLENKFSGQVYLQNVGSRDAYP
ncbi:MAG: radical SAM protein, partial [Coriobacteriales bacterium]|nr:radical SAM protein [Coriobacteriales bacterium]